MATAEMAVETAEPNIVDSEQYLTFTLDSEEYGIEILQVQEIRGFSQIRPIPHAPHYVRGVLNLRGTVVPIVDLRLRFGMKEVEYNQFTVIIVVNIGNKVVGLVVDAVSDVLNIPREHIEDVPDMGNVDTSFLQGMGKKADRLVLLLKIENLVKIEHIESL
jgi:purine-binding chemotaxis protein CheW